MGDDTGGGGNDAKADMQQFMEQVNELVENAVEILDTYGHAVDVYRGAFTEMYDAVVGSVDGNTSAAIMLEGQWQTVASLRDKISTMDTNEEDAKNTRINVAASLDNMRRQLEELLAREAQRKEAVKECESDIGNLKISLARGPGWTEDQEKSRKNLLDDVANLQRQVDLKRREHVNLHSEVDKLLILVDQEETKVRKMSDTLGEVEAQCEALREAGRVQLVRKTKEDETLVTCQENLRRIQALYREKQGRLREQTDVMARMEMQLRESKESMEAYLAQYDALFHTIQHLSEDLDRQVTTNSALEIENKQKLEAAVLRKKQAHESKTEWERLQKLKALAIQKTESAEKDRQIYEEERDALRAEVYTINVVELKTARMKSQTVQRQVGDLSREKDILDNKYSSSDKAANLIFDLTKVNENSRKNLSDEVAAYKNSIRSKRSMIEELVLERDMHENQANLLRNKCADIQEALKLQDLEIASLQRKVLASTSRLQQQQNLYEAVRSDRNIYSKNLIDIQGEIKEMKRRFKIMNRQIEQLKEEITMKDHSLVKEHFHHHNADKEKESLKNELAKIRKQIVASEHILVNQRAEIQKLNQIIREADEEKQRQVKEHAAILDEKSILGQQLTRRRGELAAVYEKIHIQASALHQGEIRYQQLCAETHGRNGLHAQVRHMEKELAEGLTHVRDESELKQLETRLEADLLTEQIKMRAVIDDLEAPLNLHRWRNLESSDPKRYESLRKVQSLQRRLIAKTEATVQKDLLIHEKERLHVELREVLGRQPGPEVAEQLALYQENLKAKVKQMAAMDEELSMYRQQVDVFKDEIQSLNDSVRGMNHDYVKKMETRWRLESKSFAAEGGAGGMGSPPYRNAPAT